MNGKDVYIFNRESLCENTRNLIQFKVHDICRACAARLIKFKQFKFKTNPILIRSVNRGYKLKRRLYLKVCGNALFNNTYKCYIKEINLSKENKQMKYYAVWWKMKKVRVD